jgi:hypothetical protein
MPGANPHSASHRRRSREPFGIALLVAAALLAGAAPPPPDLLLEWIEGQRPTTSAPPVAGRAGEVVHLDYQVRNIGGRDAFAMLLSAHTALGRVAPPRRVQPGPARGHALPQRLDLPLAVGMREVCVEARLQNLSADDPPDPEPRNNRRCRRVEVVPHDDRSATAAPFPAAPDSLRRPDPGD